MEFTTTVRVREHHGLLSHDSRVLLLGSCFSDNIGARMRGALMQVMYSPTGTMYNPLSIGATIDRIIDRRPVEGRDLIEQGGVWNSYDFHTRFALPDKDIAVSRMNERVFEAHTWLRHAQCVTITLGTAYVYRLRSTGRVVANCHKQPTTLFTREMLTHAQVSDELRRIIGRLKEFNPDLNIIITVSPIRHIADGLDCNSLSKATLRVAAGDVCDGAVCHYFPAFEIMNDELRDYRFYAADMVHPSDVAIEFMWQVLQGAYMDDRSVQAVARCERVSRRLSHRPIVAGSLATKRFDTDTRTIVQNLIEEYPYVAQSKLLKDYLDK